MARPQKTGLDYFPHDVTLSSNNKIQCVEALHGLEGYAVCIKLFEIAYQDSSGCVSIPDDEALLILANRFRLSPEITQKIIQTAIKYSLFDKYEWEARKRLTSNGIQRRIAEVNAMRSRWRKKRDEQKQGIAGTPEVILGDNPEVTPESKVKKRKENKSKPVRRRFGPAKSAWFLATQAEYDAKVAEKGQAWVDYWVAAFNGWAQKQEPCVSAKLRDHFLQVEQWEQMRLEKGFQWSTDITDKPGYYSSADISRAYSQFAG